MGAAKQIELQFEKQALFNSKEVNFRRYSQFRDGKEFDNHWEQFMVDNKLSFTKLQRDALRIVRQYAFKNGGVCNASYTTLMNTAREFYGYEISRETFRTAIDKVEDLGGCRKHEGTRLIKGRGSRTANVVIFNRIEDVRAWQIAQQKREQDEITKLLEDEYNKASVMNNYAYNRRKWAEQKQENERKKAEEQARKERERKEREAAAKRQTLFAKVLAALKAKKMATNKINEYMGVLYGSINKTIEADKQITKAKAEQIALEQFYKMIETPDNEIRKNRTAYLSHLLRSNLIAIVEGYTNTELAQKRAETQGKYVERTPDWWEERNEKEELKPSKLVDFEAAKRQFQEKLGYTTE